MSEPVMRRTRAGLFNAPALRFYSPLAKALSFCSVLSIVIFTAAPLQAQTAADSTVRYSIESPKAVEKLLLDVTRVGHPS